MGFVADDPRRHGLRAGFDMAAEDYQRTRRPGRALNQVPDWLAGLHRYEIAFQVRGVAALNRGDVHRHPPRQRALAGRPAAGLAPPPRQRRSGQCMAEGGVSGHRQRACCIAARFSVAHSEEPAARATWTGIRATRTLS